MGTNYYLHKNPCDKCGRGDDEDRLHIGKSSAGWCFSLHVIPASGINTLDDWKREFEAGEIRDEYGERFDATSLLVIITDRDWPGNKNPKRHPIDNFCIGHGPGTYDYMVGEFS